MSPQFRNNGTWLDLAFAVETLNQLDYRPFLPHDSIDCATLSEGKLRAIGVSKHPDLGDDAQETLSGRAQADGKIPGRPLATMATWNYL